METPVQPVQNTLSADQQPLNFKEWALNIFLASLPIIGIILLLVWAFSDSGNIHRRAWAKGMLLIALIGLIFTFLMFLLFGGVITALLMNQH